jgi:hypothetical protein
MIDYLNDFEDKGFFTCADILNESEREELLSNIDQIERNVLTHPENKKEMDSNFPVFCLFKIEVYKSFWRSL